MKWTGIGLLAIGLAAGCNKFTVQQDPFDPLVVSAKRPAPPPARVVLTDSSIKIGEKIQFQLGSAEIVDVSYSLLDEIAQILKDNEQIEVVQIEGHTDSTGGAKVNKKLSQKRAESVRKYLTDKGVDGKRLVAKGFGPETPIADNATPEGRDANRRVEFNIVKQGPKKTLVQDE